ncbi:MAG: hypothetical protein ACSHYF_03450 [Verrucomicrobiaceae bacterium]
MEGDGNVTRVPYRDGPGRALFASVNHPHLTMTDPAEELPPESACWDREALTHLQHDLHRSKAEIAALLEQESEHPAFDPLKVRDMIREAERQGKHPNALILGMLESASFRHFVCRGFGEESGSELKTHYFMGLTIHEDCCLSRLELAA